MYIKIELPKKKIFCEVKTQLHKTSGLKLIPTKYTHVLPTIYNVNDL